MNSITLSDWRRRVELFTNYSTLQEENLDNDYFAKIKDNIYYLRNNLRQKIEDYNLPIWCAYQKSFIRETGHRQITMLSLKNRDHILIVQIKGEIKAISFYFPDKRVSLEEFKSNSENHDKLWKFIQKEFIDLADNRLEIITGIKNL